MKAFSSDKSWKTSHFPKLDGREIQFLLDLMYAFYHEQDIVAGSNLNWPILWEYIDRQGLGGVLGSLALDDLIQIPDAVEQQASRRYFSTQMHFAQAQRCCYLVQKAAFDLDIPVIVMKGPALVAQAYPDTGVRQFSDIDLFAHSLADVKRLCSRLEAIEIKSSAKQGFFERLGESECCSYRLHNWELEFRYPVEPPGEPMFSMLSRHREALIQIPKRQEDILLPDPDLHFVFLIQHMAIHHLLSRFFWFLDIAMFLRQNSTLDLEKIEGELARFGQLNIASVVTRFCNENIDHSLPVFKERQKAWNLPVMQSFAKPENICSGKYGIYHQGWRAKWYAYLVGVVSFYLVADGSIFSIIGKGTRWTYNRIANSLGLKRSLKFFEFIFSPFIAVSLVPVTLLLMVYTKITKH